MPIFYLGLTKVFPKLLHPPTLHQARKLLPNDINIRPYDHAHGRALWHESNWCLAGNGVLDSRRCVPKDNKSIDKRCHKYVKRRVAARHWLLPMLDTKTNPYRFAVLLCGNWRGILERSTHVGRTLVPRLQYSPLHCAWHSHWVGPDDDGNWASTSIMCHELFRSLREWFTWVLSTAVLWYSSYGPISVINPSPFVSQTSSCFCCIWSALKFSSATKLRW